MTTLSHSDSRRQYSWWWSSHITPKNSKWLLENLSDMDAKVKQMIKLIEEDADSFARRAEMYYKKRPELMKLVEEFYRAYRALAERYNGATVELRQAHRTMAEAFPNQVPYAPPDDTLSDTSSADAEPQTPKSPRSLNAFLDSIDFHRDGGHAMRKDGKNNEAFNSFTSRKGLKQFHEIFESGEAMPQGLKSLEGKMRKDSDANEDERKLSSWEGFLCENQNLKNPVVSELDHKSKAEMEVQTLKKTLATIQAEKEDALCQYKQTLQRLSEMERELSTAQSTVGGLDEQVSRAEDEIQMLKEALAKLEADRDAGLLQYSQCMDKVLNLETMLYQARENAKGLNEQATKAETQAQTLKKELSAMEAEKEAALLQYKQHLEEISALENKISFSETAAEKLRGQVEIAEHEIAALKQTVARLLEEKEAAALQYEKCLKTIAKLEAETSFARVESEKLGKEVQVGVQKLRSTEEKNLSLEKSNLALQVEAENLAREIAVKDQELSKKQKELEKLQGSLQNEHLRFVQVEAALVTLQQVHSQSQEEQKTLALELKNELQMLKQLETCKQDLETELWRIKEENQSLNEQKSSSTVSLNNLQDEISSLKAMKEKLEQEFASQSEHTNVLHKEISILEEEIKGLNRRYRALILQVEAVGLNPERLSSSVKDLQDENLKLKEICQKERDEREVLMEKLKSMDHVVQSNTAMERSLSELNLVLQGSKEKIKDLQEAYQDLRGEKADLVAEKATLLSQLQIMTENMQKLLEKNTVLEKSLYGANVELEGLRAKSKGIEEFCQLLSNEKSSLLTERNILVSQLENVGEKLGNLEGRFTTLEAKCDGLEKEKEYTLNQVEQLRNSFGVEKEEHASYVKSTEARLTGLESNIRFLEEENKLRKKEFEEEVDKALNAQVEIFILQKFIQDLEEKNLTLLIECQKHFETSNLSDKLISELEEENLAQQMEAEFLQHEIKKLRTSIHQVFWSLQTDPVVKNEDMIQQDQIPLPCIFDRIEGLKSSLMRNKDENHKLMVENSILLTVLQQLRLDGTDLLSKKRTIEKELKVMQEKHVMLQTDKNGLLEIIELLRLEVSKGEQQEAALKNELGDLCTKLVDLQQSYSVLHEENHGTLEENRLLLKELSNAKEKECALLEENTAIIQEAVTLDNLSLVLEVFSSEKAAELKALSDDLNTIQKINSDLRNELGELGEKLKMKELDNLHLNKSVEKLDGRLHEITELNCKLNIQIAVLENFLKGKETNLSEAKQNLEDSWNLNFELSRTIDDLNKQHEESKIVRGELEKRISELSEDNENKTKETENFRQLNEYLECEMGTLQEEIEQHILHEENMGLELQQKSNEFELWDAEASTFYFDLQISTVQKVLLENKLCELNRVYEELKDENMSKSTEIKQMKGRINLLESEVGGLKTQLAAYAPIIVALRDDVASLENNTLNWTKHWLAAKQGEQGTEMSVNQSRSTELHESQCVIPDGVLDLQKMQTRIRGIGKAMLDEMERLAKLGNANLKPEASMEKTEGLKVREGMNEPSADARLQKAKFEISEVRNGTSMKDIPLDQVSDSSFQNVSGKRHHKVDDQRPELWETDEQHIAVNNAQNHAPMPTENNLSFHQKDARHRTKVPSTELEIEKELGVDKLELSSDVRKPNQKENRRKMLDRLASDAQQLTSLQTNIKELSNRMDTLQNSKSGKNVERETMKTQLQGVQEAVVQLAKENKELTKVVEESWSSWEERTSADWGEAGNTRWRRIIEQAQKGSEKIGRLGFEVQNIQYVLLKVEGEKKSKGKGRFSGSRTGILLRNFIYSGRGSSRRKKVRFCGCVRPSTNAD